jgi:hypothetical protein
MYLRENCLGGKFGHILTYVFSFGTVFCQQFSKKSLMLNLSLDAPNDATSKN